jgi:hypothetical protein
MSSQVVEDALSGLFNRASLINLNRAINTLSFYPSLRRRKGFSGCNPLVQFIAVSFRRGSCRTCLASVVKSIQFDFHEEPDLTVTAFDLAYSHFFHLFVSVMAV